MEVVQQSPISEHCKICSEKFDQLAVLLDHPHESILGLSLSELEDARSRFQIWQGNLGARQSSTARTSLDHRLREAPNIKNQINELLEDLAEALEEGSRLPLLFLCSSLSIP